MMRVSAPTPILKTPTLAIVSLRRAAATAAPPPQSRRAVAAARFSTSAPREAKNQVFDPYVVTSHMP